MSSIAKKVLPVGIFFVGLLVLQVFSSVLEIDRQLILAGQVWRLVTGHFVHTNMVHLLVNGVAAILIYFVFSSQTKLVNFLAWSFIFSLLTGITLLSVYPGLDWYNGLSGLLHALVAYFSVRMVVLGDKRYWLVFVVLWIKIVAETLTVKIGVGALLGDMQVIDEAHLVGAALGTSVAAFLKKRFTARAALFV